MGRIARLLGSRRRLSNREVSQGVNESLDNRDIPIRHGQDSSPEPSLKNAGGGEVQHRGYGNEGKAQSEGAAARAPSAPSSPPAKDAPITERIAHAEAMLQKRNEQLAAYEDEIERTNNYSCPDPELLNLENEYNSLKLPEKQRQAATYFKHSFALVRHLTEIGCDYDVLIGHDDISVPALRFAQRQWAIPTIYDVPEMPDRRARFGRFEKRWDPSVLVFINALTVQSMVNFDLILAVSEPIKNYIEFCGGHNCALFENWRTPNEFSNSEHDIRNFLNIPETETLLAYPNTVTNDSGIKLLCQVLKKMNAGHPTHLVFIGAINEGAKKELDQMISGYGITNYVHFIDFIEFNEYPSFLRSADAAIICINPSIKNVNTSLHNRYMDAFYSGLPIVSSQNAAAMELKEKLNIEFFDYYDWKTLCEALCRALQNRVHSQANSMIGHSAPEMIWSERNNDAVQRLKELCYGKRVAFLTGKDFPTHHRSMRICKVLTEDCAATVAVHYPFRKNSNPNSLSYQFTDIKGYF